jgi:hypothetical protein
MPGKHSDREKRQAQHVKGGYLRKGLSEEEAESRAWATVNKSRKYRARLSDLKRGGKGHQH